METAGYRHVKSITFREIMTDVRVFRQRCENNIVKTKEYLNKTIKIEQLNGAMNYGKKCTISNMDAPRYSVVFCTLS